MSDQIVETAKPKQVHAIFVGVIDQIAVQRMGNALAVASQQGVQEVHLLFQTAGGMVGDGVCLYNLFRSLPMEIILYNVGTVASIGVIAYLGADQRKTSSGGTFMIHKTTFSPVGATIDRLQSAANAAAIDDQRIESVLHNSITLSEEKWALHKVADLWLSADDAIKAGLAESIADFSPPVGEQIYYVGQT